MNTPLMQSLEEKVRLLRIADIKYHIFLCCDQAKPQCCQLEVGLESWEYLKKRLSELQLSPGVIYRTKADCLRICQQGPIAVVYPGPVWYHSCTPSVLEAIIQQHFLQGKYVKENMIYAALSNS